jgi:fibrillarin-like pre-rRNA processing protein
MTGSGEKAMNKARYPNVYESEAGRKKAFFTRSLNPGTKVYGETLVKDGKAEYREWDPWKSKLCAAMKKGISQTGLREGNVVLYLGAATGTTVSHVSDIVTNSGFVFALDFAPRVMRELVFLAEDRRNIAPVLADAARPDRFASRVSQADFIYQDIAQRDQADIFLRNCEWFLRSEGFALLCVKARSVDISRKPREIFQQVRRQLEESGMLSVVEYRELEPYQKDHCIFVCKKK